MKKALGILISIFMIFALVGCGNDEKNIGDIIENQNNDNKNNEDSEENIKLYSDDTKLVFNFNGVYQIVYYYSDDKITGLEYYYNYGDSATAKYAVTTLKSAYEQETNIKSVEQKGSYVIVKFTEKEYKDDTVEEIKQTYSYLEQIYENSEEE